MTADRLGSMDATAALEDTFLYKELRVGPGVVATFAVDPASTDPIGRWLVTHGYPHEPPNQLFHQLAPPGARVLDIGAHVGTFALAAAAFGCDVIAVEGSPRNVALMRAANARNGFEQLSIVHAAATDHDGTVRFVPQLAWGHIPPEDDTRAVAAAMELPAVRIDTVVEEAGWDGVDVVKIDVEGAELAVLRGMTTTLARTPGPAIIIEINEIALRYHASSGIEVKGLLRDAGYDLYLIDRAMPGQLIPTDAGEVHAEAVVDVLAARSLSPERLGPWFVRDALSDAELFEQFRNAARLDHAPYRGYAALAMSEAAHTASPWVRAEFQRLLDAMRVDPDPEVRDAVRDAIASIAALPPAV